LAVRGLDLADGLDRPSWTHDSAVEVVSRLLLPGTARPGLDALGWSPNPATAEAIDGSGTFVMSTSLGTVRARTA